LSRPFKGITSFSFSNTHALVILSNGQVATIGSNSHGELGNGVSDRASVLTLVRGQTNITTGLVGTDFTLFLTSDNLLLYSGVNRAASPVASSFRATERAGCRNTVSIVTPDVRVLRGHFHVRDRSLLPAPRGKLKSLSCGDGFVAVLLERKLLLRIDSDGRNIAHRRRGRGRAMLDCWRVQRCLRFRTTLS
jgi:hypothetical protein